LNAASERIMEWGQWIFHKNDGPYGFFYLIQSGFDANELPLVKALHGEEVDNVEYLSKIIKS
jgi:hypothetical protein